MAVEPSRMDEPYIIDDYGIDLKQYLTTLLRWRREILLITLVPAVAAAAVILLMRTLLPEEYEATATVAIVRTRSAVNFDERFITAADVELRFADTVAARRASLVGLVKTGVLANDVIGELGDFLSQQEQNPASLLGQITARSATVDTGGRSGASDLIEISARSDQPIKAETIANTWARLYVQQVNDIYGQTPPELENSVEAELADTRDAYSVAQAQLEAFIRDNHISQYNRLIQEKTDIIASLQEGKQTALNAFIDEVLSARRQVIAAYLSAQANNQLVAFESEQTGKQELVTEYLQALNQARVQPFREQMTVLTTTLASAHSNLLQAQTLLSDARDLRVQVESGGEAAAASSALALFLLKTQVFANTEPTTGMILQVDVFPQLTQAEFLADVDALITTLEARIGDLQNEIAEAEAALLSGDVFSNLGAEVPADSDLVAAVRQQYPRLFETGDIAQLAASIDEDNPLTRFGQERAAELLTLTGLEDLPNFSASDLPLSQALDALEAEIQTLEAQLEAEQSRLRRLTEQRDLAGESLVTLENKAAELNLSSGVLSSEVRMAANAIAPNRPVRGPALISTTLLAAIVGLLLGAGYAFLAEMMGAEPFLRRRPATT